MKPIKLEVVSFEQGVTFLSDEHPIVDDRDYCEVVSTSSSLECNWKVEGYPNWCASVFRGETDATEEELVAKAKSHIKWVAWFEEHMYDSFGDHGIDTPVVFDFEENCNYAVSLIDNYVSNCRHDEKYDEVVAQLKAIAENEFEVEE